MKALKKLLVVVMVMSLVVHPALIDILLAADPVGNNPQGPSYYPETWNPPVPPPPPPEPDPVLEEAVEEEPAPAIAADENAVPKIAGLANPLAVWVEAQGWKYELITNPDGSQTGKIVKPNGETISDKEGWKLYADATKSCQTLTPEEQAEAEKWLKVKPASVKVQPGPMTDHSSTDVYNYYDAKGNLIGSKTVSSGYSIGAETVVWKDKAGAEVARIKTDPTKFTVPSEQQPALETTFGAKPVSFTKQIDNLAKTATYTYYDAQGNKIGQMREAYAPAWIAFPDPMPEPQVTGRTYFDKNGKEISVSQDPLKDIKTGSQPLTPAQVVTDTSTTVDGKVTSTTHQVTDYTYKYINGSWQVTKEVSNTKKTMADGGSEQRTAVKTYSRDAKGVCTGVSQTCTGTSTTVSETGGTSTYTMQNYKAEFKFDEKNGWSLASESYDWVLDSSSTTVPGTQLTPEEQNDYGVIFGTKPVTVKVTQPPEGSRGASARYDYYDQDGKLIGSMYYDNSDKNAQTFVDKNGEKIDIAEKLNQDTVTADQAADVVRLLTNEAKAKVFSSDKLSAAKAAAILASDKIDVNTAANILLDVKGTNEKKVTDILAKLDTAAPTKSTNIRVKIGVGSNDITKMLPDAAADYLSKLDPAKAAAELAKLDAYTAASIIASTNMSAETAAKIFGAMAADKVAEILSTIGWWRDYYSAASTAKEIAMCPWVGPSIRAEKAADILSKMTTDQAAAILGSDKMNASMAGDILENTEAKTAGEILNKMDTGKAAGILATVATEPAANILKSMDANKAAGILASDRIDSTTAANILYALKSKDEAQLNKVLTALDTANKTKSDDIKAKIGVGSNDITKMIPDAAADYLSKLDPAKAAVELAKLTPMAALAIIASPKMSAETAAKIFGAMAADKVAEILSATSDIAWITKDKVADMLSRWPPDAYTYLDPAKAAQILSKMTKDQAAAILGSSKMENWTAGSILSNMETAAAVEILNKMDTGRAAEILSSTNIDAGAKIISSMTTDQAVKILSSDKMNSKWSAYILAQVKTETAVAILNKMTAAVAATIFSGMDTAAAATIAVAMDAKDVAAIFANDKLSVDAASQILYAMDSAKATSILQQLDLVNSAKSADLRAKLGIGSNDVSKMLPEVAAEYLSKMDPAKAAAELLKLDPNAAGAILASNKLSADMTAKIFEAMDADKAASIMSSSNYRNYNYNKAAEVLGKMNTDAAVKILTSANMDKFAAAFMLSNMATDAAIKIVSKLNADTAATFMNFMWNGAAGNILSGLDADFAAKILNSANLSVTSAGYMLSSTETTAAANILTKLVALNTPRAAEVLNYTAAYNATACAEIVNALSTDVAAKIFGNANMSAEMAATVLSNDKISVDIASEILFKVKATDAQKVTDILTKLDGINLTKADRIREKIGVKIPATPEQQVTDFYRNILGREPESQAVINSWAASLRQYGAAYVAKAFFDSAEFQAKGTADKMAALYRVILGRAPGAGETKGWENLYDSGTSLSDIANLIITHPGKEFANKSESFKDTVLNTLKIVDATKSDKGPTAEARVAAFYRNILGREAESQEAIDYWAAELKKSGVAAVVKGFFNSPEFQAKSTADKIAALYRIELGRAPEPGGAKYWGDLYESGTSLSDIAKGISQSAEFKSKAASFQDAVLNTIKIVDATKGDKGPSIPAGSIPVPAASKPGYNVIFGTDPANMNSVTANGVTTITFYDANNKVIGKMTQTEGKAAQFFDTTGKEIDVLGTSGNRGTYYIASVFKVLDPLTAAKVLENYMKSWTDPINDACFLDLPTVLTASEVGKMLAKMDSAKAEIVLGALEKRGRIDMAAVRAEMLPAGTKPVPAAQKSGYKEIFGTDPANMSSVTANGVTTTTFYDANNKVIGKMTQASDKAAKFVDAANKDINVLDIFTNNPATAMQAAMLKAMDTVTAASLLDSYIKSFGNKKNLENNVAFLDLDGYLTASEVGKILNKMNPAKADKILAALESRNIIDMDAVRAEITRVTNPPGGGHGHHSHRHGDHRHGGHGHRD